MTECFVTPGAPYLVHPSCSNQKGSVSVYERYELLGDKLLGLCLTEILLARHPEVPEGRISQMVNMLVSKKILAHVAKGIEASALFTHNVRALSLSVHASMCEVVIAAIYLEKGWCGVCDFVQLQWKLWLDNPDSIPVDFKTLLQEYTVSSGCGYPVYRVENKKGPDHACVFVCSVKVKGLGEASGSGASKRAAEEDAIQHLCSEFRIEL